MKIVAVLAFIAYLVLNAYDISYDPDFFVVFFLYIIAMNQNEDK